MHRRYNPRRSTVLKALRNFRMDLPSLRTWAAVAATGPRASPASKREELAPALSENSTAISQPADLAAHDGAEQLPARAVESRHLRLFDRRKVPRPVEHPRQDRQVRRAFQIAARDLGRHHDAGRRLMPP